MRSKVCKGSPFAPLRGPIGSLHGPRPAGRARWLFARARAHGTSGNCHRSASDTVQSSGLPIVDSVARMLSPVAPTVLPVVLPTRSWARCSDAPLSGESTWGRGIVLERVDVVPWNGPVVLRDVGAAFRDVNGTFLKRQLALVPERPGAAQRIPSRGRGRCLPGRERNVPGTSTRARPGTSRASSRGPCQRRPWPLPYGTYAVPSTRPQDSPLADRDAATRGNSSAVKGLAHTLAGKGWRVLPTRSRARLQRRSGPRRDAVASGAVHRSVHGPQIPAGSGTQAAGSVNWRWPSRLEGASACSFPPRRVS